jgi:3',5'-nucleoside bisphosphate phosphatase
MSDETVIAPRDRIDFHTHSTASDGTDQPYALAMRARRLGIRLIALTDHDTVDGLSAFISAASRSGVVGIAGVEISSKLHGNRLHTLGLGLRRTRWSGMKGFLDGVLALRNQRNTRMVEQLSSLGLEMTLDEVTAQAGGDVVARPHFARVLVNKGYATNIAEAFAKYIGDGQPGYVEKSRASVEEIVAVVHEAGGLAVAAHPNSLLPPGSLDIEPLLEELAALGYDGVEAYHPDLSEALRDRIRRGARKFGLMVSGGSDCHGRNKAHNYLGRGINGRKIFARDVMELSQELAIRAALT